MFLQCNCKLNFYIINIPIFEEGKQCNISHMDGEKTHFPKHFGLYLNPEFSEKK